MAPQHHLHLISKLRYDAALDFPYTGPYAGRGPHRKYGRKVDDDNRPTQYLKATTVEGHIQTCVYQAQRLHKEVQQPLNVVLIAKTNLRTQARAHVMLFSRDPEEHTSELQSQSNLVCRLLLEKKKKTLNSHQVSTTQSL